MKQLFKKLIEENPLEPTVKIVYKCLYKEIISLRLLPGSKINLSKISEELNVSRTTVRDAAILLSSNTKLVKMHSNQGFFVSNLNLNEMEEICTAMKIIEIGAAQILCEKIACEQLIFLVDLTNKMSNYLKENDLYGFTQLDILFHKSIIELCENKFISAMYRKISDIVERYLSYITFLKNKNDFLTIIRNHNMIINSLENSLINNVESAIQMHCNELKKIFLHPEIELKFEL
ncbi:MAG: GntR family transcriptional regulator [Eubacteriaceae bacterium]